MDTKEMENMEDLGEALEESYAYMGNGEYDTDTLLAWEKIKAIKDNNEIIKVTIDEAVNKGAIAHVEGIRAFIPISRLDINHVENVNEWIGKEIRVRIIEADMESDKLVLSAREILREESAVARKAKREQEISNIEVGSIVDGVVDSLQSYGAFIKLSDEISGLVHISQISNTRINSPKDVLKVGDKVKAKVIKNEDGKISLSIKELLEEERIKEEEEIKSNMPKSESIGTSLGSLFANLKIK